MSLLTHTSKKTQSNQIKKKAKTIIRFLKSIKYELLIAFEIIALVFGTIYCLFGRKKQFSFWVAISTLIGTLVTISGVRHINSKLKSRKYVDIIATEKKDSTENTVETESTEDND